MTVDVAPWLMDSRWPTVPIRYVARLGTGHTPSRQHPEYWENCTVPWVTLADVKQIRDGRTQVISQTEEKISPLGIANSSAVRHPAGTVILSRTASVGFSAILGANMATSQDFATWTCSEKIVPKFLLHSLRAMAPDLRRVAMGSTHKTIYMPEIANLRVALPPPEEQRRIANFLDAETARIDRLVELRNAQNSLLCELLDAALAKIFDNSRDAVKTRVKFLLREKPRYGVLVPVIADEGVPMIRIMDLAALQGGVDLEVLPSSVVRIPRELSEQYKRTVVREGDVLISVVGTLGRTLVASAGLVGSNVNRAIAVLRAKAGVDPHLLAAWVRTSEFSRQALLATGNDSAQRTLGMEDLANFEIHWPINMSVQEVAASEVAQIVSRHIKTKMLLRSQIDLLSERRQALITAAVTGQIDVTTSRGTDLP